MMGRCLQAAKDDPLPPISLQDVDAVLPARPAKKAKGVDPVEARQQLADILNAIECCGAWPSSLSTALDAAIPKGGGWQPRAWLGSDPPQDLV
eukprot:7502324-Pyramimonas_sp.AAC.1